MNFTYELIIRPLIPKLVYMGRLHFEDQVMIIILIFLFRLQWKFKLSPLQSKACFSSIIRQLDV